MMAEQIFMRSNGRSDSLDLLPTRSPRSRAAMTQNILSRLRNFKSGVTVTKLRRPTHLAHSTRAGHDETGLVNCLEVIRAGDRAARALRRLMFGPHRRMVLFRRR